MEPSLEFQQNFEAPYRKRRRRCHGGGENPGTWKTVIPEPHSSLKVQTWALDLDLRPSFLCSRDAMIPKLVLVAVCHVTGALEAGGGFRGSGL